MLRVVRDGALDWKRRRFDGRAVAGLFTCVVRGRRLLLLEVSGLCRCCSGAVDVDAAAVLDLVLDLVLEDVARSEASAAALLRAKCCA